MRIVIDMEHTPTSPGASGYLDELSCDRAAGERIIAELERRGHTVYDSTPADWVAYPQEVNERCYYTNSLWNIDLFCSLHLNAGGGHGTEVLYFEGDGDGAWWASQISKNVAKALGITNRGAKPNNWVGVICNTNPTAVLIEFCFVDSWEDAEAWWACPWDNIVNAVCDGIEGRDWNGESPQPQPQPQPEPQPAPKDDIRYRVSIDPYGNEWCDEMVGSWDTGSSGDDYAGVLGHPICWLSCDAPKYRVYTEDGRWLDWVYSYNPNDLVNGTAGDGSPIKLLEIPDSGIWYQVHTVAGEWLPWMLGNTDSAGSSDSFAGDYTNIDGIRMERAVGGEVSEPSGTKIMGESETSVNQMVNCFKSKGKDYPSDVYSKYGALDVREFCQILSDAAESEGVRAEVVFAQAMHETGWLQFGNDVKADQCNFAGIGATGGGEPGNRFKDVREGLLAQTQHLKAYASTDDLVNDCVDPRFGYITRGCAPTVEELGGHWAPSSLYGDKVKSLMDILLATDATPEPAPQPEPAPIIDEKIGLLQKLLELIQKLLDFFRNL